MKESMKARLNPAAPTMQDATSSTNDTALNSISQHDRGQPNRQSHQTRAQAAYRSQLISGVEFPNPKGTVHKQAAEASAEAGAGQAAGHMVQLAACGRGKVHAPDCPLPCGYACHAAPAQQESTLLHA